MRIKKIRIAMRAAHIIGENTRVLKGKELLSQGKLAVITSIYLLIDEEFGKLMFESHESSSKSFENSCKELDVIVNCAKSIPQVFGARYRMHVLFGLIK